MSVAGRVATGAALLILLLAGALAYHLSLLQRLVRQQQEFIEATFEVVLSAQELNRVADDIEEAARKLQVTEDPDYALRLLALGSDYQAELATLASQPLPDPVRDSVSALQAEWRQASLVDLWASPGPMPGAALPDLLNHLARLRAAANQVIEVARGSVRSETGRLLRRREEAERISWAVLGVALALGLAVLALTVRSIRRGMKALTAGTQAVAAGDFTRRIDAGGGELGQLADAFNRMTTRLHDLEQLKTELLSRVSHELRTPLVAMYETNQLLLEELPGPLTAKQRRLLEINLEGGRRLAAMIGKLLDLSSLETGAATFELSPHDLTELARRAFGEFEGRARERGVSLLLDELPAQPLVSSCDGERILQVVENLLDNAIKHAPTGSAVQLRVSHRPAPPQDLPRQWLGVASPGAAGVALISVLDRGPGVPDEQKERIFDKFHRLASGRRDGSADGVGLGLAICHEIAVAHRGAIWVRDRQERGSEFFFLIGADTAPGNTRIARGAA